MSSNQLQDDFWVGKPKVVRQFPDPTFCSSDGFYEYILPISPGAESYELISNSPILVVHDTTPNPGHITLEAFMPGNYTITLTTRNSCGSNSTTIYVTVEQCGGFFFRAYPNPTDTNLTIEKLETNEQRHSIASSNNANLQAPNSY